MNVLLVGGAGYIGSRLARTLEERGHTCQTIDAGILARPGSFHGEHDVRSGGLSTDPFSVHFERESFTYPDRAPVVIWLASIHDVPKDQEEQWREIAYDLMVRLPEKWAKATIESGGRFIYFSSTRAGTHPDRLYGWLKRRFERVRPFGTTVVRPGTVWGALSETLPNRCHTVVNRMLIDSQWLPEPLEEPFFTCQYAFLERVVVDLVERPQTVWQGLVVPLTDTLVPITGAKLAGGWRPQGYASEAVPRGLEMGEHPMEAYRRYYLESLGKETICGE